MATRDKIRVVMNGLHADDKPTVRRRRLVGLTVKEAIARLDEDPAFEWNIPPYLINGERVDYPYDRVIQKDDVLTMDDP